MSKKKKVVDNHEKLLKSTIKSLLESIKDWKHINENGCNDPFWCDGSNMNLVRNHIISYKKQIEDICLELDIKFPDEYYQPIPPIVDDNYMANYDNKERVNRLKEYDEKLTNKKVDYDDNQLSIF